ncbi:replication factor C subunit 1 isoform X1 [Bufo gargarizans]|uniref:replication factor C subunit 1 isoform X1 n=1 Tax=Bufo gargarizans TaxID=30331 RepID=UPI001CF444FD|nr:replication factor C subunit 1 isoform X1 [Bufo gargarizans]
MEDIRRFFNATPVAKKSVNEKDKKENLKSTHGVASQKKSKDRKLKSPVSDEELKKQQSNKKKRIIYDSDSEEDTPPLKKSKKPREVSPPISKPLKIKKPDPVDYVSDTDEEDFAVLKKPKKPKENGTAAVSPPSKSPVTSNKTRVPAKVKTPEKRVCTSAIDFFGMGSVKRSHKKLVETKKEEPRRSTDDSMMDDEAIARELQLAEDEAFEKQLHEDEEFAKTLAMIDDTPRDKAHRNGEKKQTSPALKKSPKSEKPSARTISQSDALTAVKKEKDIKEETKKASHAQSESSSSAKEKSSPVKSSSKLALMKKKDEVQEKEVEISSPITKTKVISPKKEEVTPVKTSRKSESSPEDSEKKRGNYTAYRNYLNREGPKALGSKEIPQGADNCLEGLTFVITGVLESIERDEAKSLVERYGGKVTGNVSKKTNYLIMGRDGGESKREKAESLGTKIIDEDGLFDLIHSLPGKKSKYVIAAEAEMKTKVKAEKTPKKVTKKPSPVKRTLTPEKRQSPRAKKLAVEKTNDDWKMSIKQEEKPCSVKSLNLPLVSGKTESLLWVDKYKPTSVKAIIGQQGEQSCANKLIRWLKDWHKNHSTEDKKPAVKYSKFGGKDDGSSFKAALLSGPPGVGKTTTAVLVCEELDYSYVELNASDTRSKNSMKEVVAESLNNTSIKGFYSGTSKFVNSKHVLIMDEVDGMAGNEDRGGVQELIALIKGSKIPIICMCNDRNHPKIRSLSNYCFDLRFQRPRLEQIKGAMMSVAFKEGLKIPPPAMNEVILGANQDIRQVLHNLSMWCASSKALSYDDAKSSANNARKDIKMGPFDVVRKVFVSGEETARMTLIDKSDLFFHDYSMGPLFVQENYIHVKPAAAGGNVKKHLMLLSKAADSICDGDIVDRAIRSKQVWSLLPTQAIYASVIPGELMRGYMSQFPSFPSWLGKYSSTGKHGRITQDLSMHTSLRTRTSKCALNLDYLPYLRDKLVQPLTAHGTDGVQEVVDLMDTYYLMKEDYDNLMEICSWGGKPTPFSKLDPKVKAAFTRGYNKEAHLTPYSLQIVKASKKDASSTIQSEYGEEGNIEDTQAEENRDDDVTVDAMIKAKKAKPSKSAKTEKGGDKKPGKAKSKKAK